MNIKDEVTSEVMSPEEEAYRTELRDVIAQVTIEFLEANRNTIVAKAVELIELRKRLSGQS